MFFLSIIFVIDRLIGRVLILAIDILVHHFRWYWLLVNVVAVLPVIWLLRTVLFDEADDIVQWFISVVLVLVLCLLERYKG